MTPLIVAAAHSTSAEIVKLLIDSGAELEASDPLGMTPLLFATGNSSPPEIVKLLIDSGAELEVTDLLGMTPLMYTAQYSSSPEIIKALLDKGADPLARNKDGKMAIDYAKKNKMLVGTKAYQRLLDKSME